MSWAEWHAAITHLAEERIGTLVREAKQAEDAKATQSANRLRTR